MVVLSAEQWHSLARTLFVAAGASEANVTRVAEASVDSSLVGHDSHVVIRIIQYLQAIAAGHLGPASEPRVVKETFVTSFIDGQWTFDQVSAEICMKKDGPAGQEQRDHNLRFGQRLSHRPLGDYVATPDATLRRIKAVLPARGIKEVLLPGEPELRTRAQRRVEGASIPDNSWQAMQQESSRYGVDVAASVEWNKEAPMPDRSPLQLSVPEYKAKAEVVYDELRRAINGGDLKPGDRLVAEEIATLLHVSRMPVREAIQRLQAEGLVEMIPYKGATVAMATLEQLKELFSIRAVLEGLASREAALMATDEDRARLEALSREMEQTVVSGDTDVQLRANREIHKVIWQITGNQMLQAMAASLFSSVERYRRQLMQQSHKPEEALEEHRQIIQAILDHAPDRAEQLTRQHVLGTGRLMAGYTENDRESTTRSGGQVD